MIINSEKSNIEVVGDVREFKTSIDPKNLEFITTLLSSNLYSHPEQSFIREIVSNAWDSHVEAGTTDIPVIVRFKKSGNYYSITVRDYGTGMSPERFQDVYCNIGSSTKRESNDFIGGFGIGKYSALACTNTVYITSYYEGTANYYVMVKSGNSITTTLMSSQPTSEKNGVEVTIRVRDYAVDNYRLALKCITFFPNIYVDGLLYSDIINSTKVKKFKNFAAASTSVSLRLLLGNVLYPIDESHLSKEASEFIGNLYTTGIVIRFDVGELNITPNRENIIYTSDTIKKIEDRVIAAKNELYSLIIAKLEKDYDDIYEYFSVLTAGQHYDPITDSLTKSEVHYHIVPSDIPGLNITYCGQNLIPYMNNINSIFNVKLPNFRGKVRDCKILTKNFTWSSKDSLIGAKKILVLNEGARLTAVVKSYLRDNYDGYNIMTFISEKDFLDYVKDSKVDTSQYTDIIVAGAYKAIMNRAEFLDLNNDAEFLAYKISTSSKTGKVKDLREAILYVYDSRGYRVKKTFHGFQNAVQYIKDLKSGVILANMDADDNTLEALAHVKGFAYIKARKDVISYIKDLNLKCVVDIDWYIDKDPVLSIIKTLAKYFPNGFARSMVTAVMTDIDYNVYREFKDLAEIECKYSSNYTYRGLAMRDCIPYDSYTEHLCLKLKKYLEGYKKVKDILDECGCNNQAITTATVIRTKAYRVNSKAYNSVKNNKLLNILCRK